MSAAKNRVRITIIGEYELRPGDYMNPGDQVPTPEEMALVDERNYATGGVSEADLIDWLDPGSIKVRFEVAA